MRFHNLSTGNTMNSKATQKTKTAADKKSTAKVSKTPSEKTKAKAKGRKASQRNTDQEASRKDQTQELPAYATRPVQLHECIGTCVIFLEPDPLWDSDPTFLDRFRAALAIRYLELSISTDSEVFELTLRPFCLKKPTGADGVEAPAPVEPRAASEPGSAAR